MVSLAHFARFLPSLNTKIVAITGQKDQEHKSLAMKAGFDAVLFKPVALTEIKAVLASVVPAVAHAGQRHNGQEACEFGSRATFADWRSTTNQERSQIKNSYTSRKRSSHL